VRGPDDFLVPTLRRRNLSKHSTVVPATPMPTFARTLALACILEGAAVASSGAPTSAVSAVAVRTAAPVVIDGRADDPVWHAAPRVDSLGWTAEFAIPLSQLRYLSAPQHTFGFAIWRDIERYKERASWPAYRPSQIGFVSQLGDLAGIEGIPARHRFDVM